jgi:uncharacterized repeat protein (TIGR03803 family)
MQALRLVVAIGVLSASAPWIAYGQTHEGTSDPSVAAQSQEAPIYTVLYTFTGGTDGYPDGQAPLILDRAGNLYGTAEYGGDLSCNGGFGCGVVFKIDPTGWLRIRQVTSTALPRMAAT